MPKAPLIRPAEWLLLIHQLPAKPAYLRVKVWRRLQAIGAVPIKNAVYALPASDRSASEMCELLSEITTGGGEALICRTRLVAGLTDTDLRAMFDAARDADYEELAQEARILLADDEVGQVQVAKLHARCSDIGAIDFFGAHAGQDVDVMLAELEKRVRRHPDVSRSKTAPSFAIADLKGRTWVTRRGVHVDRIASAWLIRRFIDPTGSFKFVDGKAYVPQKGELRFDMADAEFTHEGDRCTFETLVLRAGLEDDAALRSIAEIVHELDIADGKFCRPEAAGVAALIAGLCAATDDDDERLFRGTVSLEGLYAHFRKSRGS
jgi:hypothetical protein